MEKRKVTFKNPNKLTEEEIMDVVNLSFSDDDEETSDVDFLPANGSSSESDSGRSCN